MKTVSILEISKELKKLSFLSFLSAILQLQKKFIEKLLNNKEIEIDGDSNFSLDEKELKLLEQLAKEQWLCPIIIIHNYKPEIEENPISANQTSAKKEKVEITTKQPGKNPKIN